MTNPLALSFLSLAELEDFQVERVADAARVGYELERQWATGTNSYQTFDHLSYHPNINRNERGYIYIIKTDMGTSNYDEKWFPATLEGEAALKAILAGDEVRCPVSPVQDKNEVGAAGSPLVGGDLMWFTALDVTVAPVKTASKNASPQKPNAAGSIYVQEDLNDGFTMGGAWMNGADFVRFLRSEWAEPAGVFGDDRWLDHLTVKHVEPVIDGYARYDWQAYFPQPGCYMLYAYADGGNAVKVYLEVNEQP